MRILIFRRFQKGQSVIEAVISVAVVSLIIVALVSAVTVSVRNSTFAKNKTLTTKYVNEGMEAVRSIRERDWQELTSGTHGLKNTAGVWTFNTTISDTPATGFVRQIEVTPIGSDDDKFEVKVTVSWIYGSKNFSSSAETSFTKWKQ